MDGRIHEYHHDHIIVDKGLRTKNAARNKVCCKRKRGKELGGGPTKPTSLRCQKSSLQSERRVHKKALQFFSCDFSHKLIDRCPLSSSPELQKNQSIKKKTMLEFCLEKRSSSRCQFSLRTFSLYSSASASFRGRRRRPVISTGSPLTLKTPHIIGSHPGYSIPNGRVHPSLLALPVRVNPKP